MGVNSMFWKTINGWIIGGVVILQLGVFATGASAVDIFFNDAPKNGGVILGSEETFSFGGWGQDENASANGNEFMVLSAGGDLSGAGIAAHVDINHPGFGGDGLQNGNVIRLSMWIARAPDAPLTIGPNFIDVLKVEFYDLALANPNTNPGNKILDTDTSLGVATPFEPDINTEDWTQFVHTYVVNSGDFPAGDLSVVQEVRGVIFAGDFANASDQSGAMYVDRIRMEVFDNEAAVTPIDMTNPGALVNTVTPGDFNGDGSVNAADYTIWRNNLNAATDDAINNNGDQIPGINAGDYAVWKTNFGPGGAGALAGGSPVPEPGTLLLAIMTVLGGVFLRRSR
jgi:hypothetical protein